MKYLLNLIPALFIFLKSSIWNFVIFVLFIFLAVYIFYNVNIIYSKNFKNREAEINQKDDIRGDGNIIQKENISAGDNSTIIIAKEGVSSLRHEEAVRESHPVLDLCIGKYEKTITLSKGTKTFIFEPLIVNSGTAIARHVNLHIKFRKDLIVNYRTDTWSLYKDNIYNVLEYNGGVNNVVHVGVPLGLRELSVTLPNNFEGLIEVPFWIICEDMDKREGKLVIEVK
jgi:hypothetical protein